MQMQLDVVEVAAVGQDAVDVEVQGVVLARSQVFHKVLVTLLTWAAAQFQFSHLLLTQTLHLRTAVLPLAVAVAMRPEVGDVGDTVPLNLMAWAIQLPLS